jgi:hypothetical protein
MLTACAQGHDEGLAARRAKQLLPFFQRTGKVAGIVEFVLSGHRLKVCCKCHFPTA